VSCEYVVERATANLPQSTSADIFEVSGGKVLILGIVGKVTTSVQAQANSSSVSVHDLEIWSANLSGASAGSLLGADATVHSETVAPMAGLPLVADDGLAVSFACGASSTGQVSWTLWYKPLEPGAQVTAA